MEKTYNSLDKPHNNVLQVTSSPLRVPGAPEHRRYVANNRGFALAYTRIEEMPGGVNTQAEFRQELRENLQSTPEEMLTMKKLSKPNISMVLVATLLYWVWESQAEGNIRIDLLLLYPILFAIYIGAFWKRYKFYSIFFSIGIMILNIIFFMSSYELFGKTFG